MLSTLSQSCSQCTFSDLQGKDGTTPPGRGWRRRRRGVVKAVIHRKRNSYSFNPRYLQTAPSSCEALIRRPFVDRAFASRVHLHPLKTSTYPPMATNWLLAPPPPSPPVQPKLLPTGRNNVANDKRKNPRLFSPFDVAKMDPINWKV